MNPIAEDILSHYTGTDEEFLMHYGMPRRSGRYPWGSGDDPYQHGSRDFLGRVEELRKQKFEYVDENGKKWTGDTAIAKSMGYTTGQFRTELGIATNERRMLNVARARSLREDGKGWTEIGREMGVRESTVRGWLEKASETRMTEAQTTADFLKKAVDEKGMVDVGKGVPQDLRISKERMKQALYLLEREGYKVYEGGIPQLTNANQQTTQTVLCKPGTQHKDIYQYDKVHSLKDYISRDGGETYEKKFTYPESMDSKRLKIRYNEEGGLERDGLVEIRRGVPDLSLGESRYSQVRILVDGSHYIKGMAVYSDNLPDGVDVVFNTNKKKGTAVTDVLKEIKQDPDNPFGSAIKDANQGGQYWYDPKTGQRVSANHPNAKLGLINKRADEGDWSDWKDALPSQFLGKQSRQMAEKQLNIAKADKMAEYDEICALTNPTVKKHMLEKFASECDSAAVNLQAASLPGQQYHAIIPINTLKDNEVYAPNYPDGSKLALIRYPHGGTFEIPICTVNNNNKLANSILGKDVGDAVGINSKVAERLSGADFDGDTVMCIPTNDRGGKVKITAKESLKGLEGFDPKEKYGPASYEGREVRLMSKKYTQKQMGVISNLITDMTLAGAEDDELAAAVRHSMVVIDAHKHKLDYRQSEVDNNIAALHKKYQGKASGGASTILSRAKGEYSVPRRKGTPWVNQKGKDWYDPNLPEGALIYKTDPNATYTYTKTNKRTGETKEYTNTVKQKSTKMAETRDAYTLVSDARHPMELVYADYANSMKALANKARKEMVYTGKIEYSKSAKAVYKNEVDSLMEKLREAQLNAPRNREVLRRANVEIAKKENDGVFEDKAERKKAAQKAITKYRDEVGAISRKERNINITDKEWEAIQAGAISEQKLKDILDNTDIDVIRDKATPRSSGRTVTTAQQSRIKALSGSYTISQIADKMNLSPSAVSKILKGEY